MINIKSNSANIASFRRIAVQKKALDGGIHSALLQIGRANVKEARSELIKKKTGRVYRYYINGRRINHTASAPYESPAYLTGALSKGYSYQVTGSKFLEWGNDVSYSVYLELGAPKANLIRRPNIIKVVKKHRGLVMKYLTNAIAT